MTDKIIIDGVDVSGCEFYSTTGQCKIQQVFQRNEIVGIIEKPYGNFLECNLCNSICYYKQLQKTRNAYCKLNNLYNDNCKIIEELEDILQDIKILVTTDYIQIKRQLVQNYDCLDNFMQKIEDKCGEVL